MDPVALKLDMEHLSYNNDTHTHVHVLLLVQNHY